MNCILGSSDAQCKHMQHQNGKVSIEPNKHLKFIATNQHKAKCLFGTLSVRQEKTPNLRKLKYSTFQLYNGHFIQITMC